MPFGFRPAYERLLFLDIVMDGSAAWLVTPFLDFGELSSFFPGFGGDVDLPLDFFRFFDDFFN